MANGLLEGTVVLDLTRVLAGPYCGMLLADMGATVIKIEMVGKGDDSRAYGPFVSGQSCYYMGLNRGKKGCTLNLKTDEGREVFLAMVQKADILIENYRPGTMEKLHLGYEDLKKVNPGLIYGAVSGYGHTGPYSKRAGYDIIGQAAGGLMSTTGWEGGAPTRTGTPMGDVLGGLNLTIGILAALNNKNKTGEGEKVDVALVDSVVSAMQNINMIYLNGGRIPTRIGNRYESTYPYDSFRTSDGDVIIGAGNDKLYATLCDVMGMPELKEDPRFLTVSDRVKNHAALKELIEAWTMRSTIDEVADQLNKVGVPSTPINTIDRIVKDPQIAGARKMFPSIRQPGIGDVPTTNNALKFTNHPADPETPAPSLGQDNDTIFQDYANLSPEQIELLREKKII